MANIFDQIGGYLKSLQATPLNPIYNVQQGLQAIGQYFPTQTGQILAATRPAQTAIENVRQAPTQVAKAVTPVVQNIARSVIAPRPVAAVKPVVAKTIPKIVSQVAKPQQSFASVTPKVLSPIIQQKPTVGSATRALSTPNQSQIDSQMLAQAKADNAGYYQRLLEENNYDINAAKQKLEQDYQQGLRQSRENSDIQQKNLFGQTIPQEQMQTAESLNQRGLLSTPTGKAQQLSTTLSTGETVNPTNPYLTRSYGGIGGDVIGQMQKSQQARSEAIGKALAQREENLTTPYNQNIAQNAVQGQREQAQIRAQQDVANQQLAGERENNLYNTQRGILGSIYS